MGIGMKRQLDLTFTQNKKKNELLESVELSVLNVNCDFCEIRLNECLTCHFCNRLFCSICAVVYFTDSDEIEVCLDCRKQFLE